MTLVFVFGRRFFFFFFFFCYCCGGGFFLMDWFFFCRSLRYSITHLFCYTHLPHPPRAFLSCHNVSPANRCLWKKNRKKRKKKYDYLFCTLFGPRVCPSCGRYTRVSLQQTWLRWLVERILYRVWMRQYVPVGQCVCEQYADNTTPSLPMENRWARRVYRHALQRGWMHHPSDNRYRQMYRFVSLELARRLLHL